MKNNKKGFSIVIAMGLVLLISLLALSILEYIIPFSKNVKGIENTGSSYYNAVSALENALWFTTKNPSTDSTTTIQATATGFSYDIIANGNLLPPYLKGNSEFDKNWNKINSGNPIQLEVGNNKVNWNNFKLYIRVPNIDLDDTTAESFSGTQDIINWQLSASGASLNASGSYIKGSNICDSNATNCTPIDFTNKSGVTLDGIPQSISEFYGTPGNNCIGTQKCTLKLSVINKLEWKRGINPGGSLPYLEWKLSLNPNRIPLNNTYIEATGKSFGFTKKLNIRVPQKTTIDAFNFTIFQ